MKISQERSLLQRYLPEKYVIEEELGRGGFGIVFRARDTALKRLAAIKMLNAAHNLDAEVVRKFEQEAQIAARLKHPNIVVIYDIAGYPDCNFFIMEFIAGESIGDHLVNKGIFGQQQTVELASEIAGALHYAHRNGVIHRDIKPDNIIVTKENRPVVMDFGIAKAVHRQAQQSSRVFGTAPYLAPEQLVKGEIDARIDQFAFGVLLFRMLTGKLPFPKLPQPEILFDYQQRKDVVLVRPSVYLPAINPHLELLIMKCLAFTPQDRFSDMSIVQQQLEALPREEIKDIVATLDDGSLVLQRASAQVIREVIGLLGDKEYDKAIALLEEGLAEDPANRDFSFYLTKAQQLRDEQTVIDECFELGAAAYQQKDYEAALRRWQKILALDGANQRARDFIKQAERLLQRQQKAQSSGAGDAVGHAAGLSGRIDADVFGETEAGAGSGGEGVASLDPHEQFAAAAGAAEQRGDYQEALNHWRQILNRQPDHQQARMGQARCRMKLALGQVHPGADQNVAPLQPPPEDRAASALNQPLIAHRTLSLPSSSSPTQTIRSRLGKLRTAGILVIGLLALALFFGVYRHYLVNTPSGNSDSARPQEIQPSLVKIAGQAEPPLPADATNHQHEKETAAENQPELSRDKSIGEDSASERSANDDRGSLPARTLKEAAKRTQDREEPAAKTGSLRSEVRKDSSANAAANQAAQLPTQAPVPAGAAGETAEQQEKVRSLFEAARNLIQAKRFLSAARVAAQIGELDPDNETLSPLVGSVAAQAGLSLTNRSDMSPRRQTEFLREELERIIRNRLNESEARAREANYEAALKCCDAVLALEAGHQEALAAKQKLRQQKTELDHQIHELKSLVDEGKYAAARQKLNGLMPASTSNPELLALKKELERLQADVDESPPTLADASFPAVVSQVQSIPVTVSARDNVSIKSVSIVYRDVANKTHSIAMQHRDDDRWQGEIPEFESKKAGALSFATVATDAAGNQARLPAPEAEWFEIKVMQKLPPPQMP